MKQPIPHIKLCLQIKVYLIFIKDNSLTIGEIKVIKKNWSELLLSLLSGNTLILIDGWPEAISNSTKGGESRAVTEPTTQIVIRGPKESF
ncbi:hypothetical protein GCM10020331_083370 [Ectobacillus funiculus]